MFNYLKKFFYILPAKKKKLILILFSFIFVSVIEVFGIGLIAPFIKLANNPNAIFQIPWLNSAYTLLGVTKPNHFIALIGLVIAVLFCIKSSLSWWIQTYVSIFCYKQKGELSQRLLQAYLAAPYTFHLGKGSAYIIQNVINETKEFTNLALLPIVKFASDFIIVLCFGLLLVVTNLVTVIVILGMLLPLVLLFNSFKNKLNYWGKQASDANEAAIRIINHGLGGIKETKVIGCSSYFGVQLIDPAQKFTNSMSNFLAFTLLPRIVIEWILVLFLIGLTSVCLILNQDIQQLTAVLSIFALASIQLIPAASNLASGVSMLRYSSITVNKLYHDLKELETLETEEALGVAGSVKAKEYRDNQNRDRELAFSQQIVLEAVNYRYPNATENALNALWLTLHKGQSIAFIGRSGAGKTTLIDVILGLLIPNSGDIKVDGKSIYYNLRRWQDLIGYIPQSIFLIDDTVERNIAFGVPDSLIDRQRLSKAIQAAQLEELIESLPQGSQTAVGERGVLLSGGQRQRIGIARALYHEREILVLDEATAALDNETEALVTEAIKSLSGTKTIIIIAHRLSTIEHCDRIYLMEEGRIVKSGSYAEVVLENANFS